MADFVSCGPVDGMSAIQREFNVASGTTASIAIGDLVVVDNGFAAKVANGGCGAGNIFVGIAISASDETAGTAGTVQVMYHPSGLIVEGIATTPGNLVAGVLFDKVTVDVGVTGDQTIDENDAGALTIWEIFDDSTTTGRVRVVLPWTFAS